MNRNFLFGRLAVCLAVYLAGPDLLAAGGTSVVAQKGKTALIQETWPEGVGELVNDPARTTGWNSWFTEWPNDVNQYAFDVSNTDDANRLIQILSQVKAPLRQVRLSYLKEPRGLGWVTSVPEGNGIAVLLSIGDQTQMDQWFRQVRKPFGKIEFLAAPVAVPPTLTIFVQNDAIDLKALKIPAGITVSAGYVPTVFHQSNTKREREREANKPANGLLDTSGLELNDRETAEAINSFLNALQQQEQRGSPQDVDAESGDN